MSVLARVGPHFHIPAASGVPLGLDISGKRGTLPYFGGCAASGRAAMGADVGSGLADVGSGLAI